MQNNSGCENNPFYCYQRFGKWKTKPLLSPRFTQVYIFSKIQLHYLQRSIAITRGLQMARVVNQIVQNSCETIRGMGRRG